MQVDPKLTAGVVTWVDTSHTVARKARAETDHVTFAGAKALEEAYKGVPDVRQDVVSRARELVAQSTYPPPETIKRLANLLAMELSNDRP
jgi:hypothetical protein